MTQLLLRLTLPWAATAHDRSAFIPKAGPKKQKRAANALNVSKKNAMIFGQEPRRNTRDSTALQKRRAPLSNNSRANFCKPLLFSPSLISARPSVLVNSKLQFAAAD
jgi:hypothetical protein